MSKFEDLHTLVRLLKEFELPVSPILEYAIMEKEKELAGQLQNSNNDADDFCDSGTVVLDDSSSFSTIKEEYSAFVRRIKSEKSANENLQILDGPVRRYINQIVDFNANSIYSFDNLAVFRSCMLKLNNNDDFVESNLRRHHKYSGALSIYQRFLEKRENGNVL